MVELSQLWMPIVVSAVIVFVASSILWMVLPIHKNDYRRPPNEDALMDAVRAQGMTHGLYAFPYCKSSNDMKDQAVQRKLKEGPWGCLVLAAGPPNMGKALGGWFVHLLIISLFVAYVTGRALPAGTEYLRVFQIAGAAAFLGYAGGWAPKAIWEGHTWSYAVKQLFDGLIYALLTAGVFGWLWPGPIVAA